ncbi:hypothetical protein PGT21_003259 [Puccinia graminis f. sp. tritici]|uniref:Uncharacterized protein n=1 Tax=Puccinia graminis f. sp. tritici TaxID=56615 RepID=A0A5B0S996_PUCGR|nr:hypothetical protein PGT21_003259 [Puccinia graminis f. sp. tritici]KAA1133673.1 hypothetical protein PGTUg99_030622 [Puccinia graminis f. sp. tritici]
MPQSHVARFKRIINCPQSMTACWESSDREYDSVMRNVYGRDLEQMTGGGLLNQHRRKPKRLSYWLRGDSNSSWPRSLLLALFRYLNTLILRIPLIHWPDHRCHLKDFKFQYPPAANGGGHTEETY